MLVHTEYIFNNELSRDADVFWCLFKATYMPFVKYCKTEKAFVKMLNSQSYENSSGDLRTVSTQNRFVSCKQRSQGRIPRL